MWYDLVIFVVLIGFTYSDYQSKYFKTRQKHVYPTLYRDYVVKNLTGNARDVFFSLGKHPRCLDLKGLCIPRGKCRGVYMMYLTRGCYRHHLVCCYDYRVVHPAVQSKSVSTTTSKSATTSTTTTTEKVCPKINAAEAGHAGAATEGNAAAATDANAVTATDDANAVTAADDAKAVTATDDANAVTATDDANAGTATDDANTGTATDDANNEATDASDTNEGEETS